MKQTRREFLKTSLSGMAYFSTASTVPLWLSKSAQAACLAGVPDDRILVIYQQAGGNDGLNTVIPYTDPKYYLPENDGGLRPNLRISTGLELGDGLNAFHPKLSRLKSWYDSGNLAVIQNVGYPNPNFSHFISTDLWELGISPSGALETEQGWLSRFFDNQCDGGLPNELKPLAMMSNGTVKLPLALSGSINYFPPSVRSFDSYSIDIPTYAPLGQHIEEYINTLNNLTVTLNSDLDFIQRASIITQASIEDMAIANQVPLINQFPGYSDISLPIESYTLGPGLEMVSKIIRAGDFGTRIFFVQQGGYDNHANQFGYNGSTPDPVNLGDHPALLNEADASLDAFLGAARPDTRSAHKLAEIAGNRKSDVHRDILRELVLDRMREEATTAARTGRMRAAERIAAADMAMQERMRMADAFNLDRKQDFLTLLADVHDLLFAARTS